MQQTENLAPHVNEIARALQNRMEPEAIEDELRRYLEYGVPLGQAKRDIVRMHGGNLNAGEKKLATILPDERGLDLTVKVITVNPKEITVKGAPRTIFYGFLADDSAKVSFTSWKAFDTLQKGAMVHIKGAYAKKGFREGVEINLGDYTTVVHSDAKMDVKDDFVAGAGPIDGASTRMSAERKVRELRDGQSSVTLTGRILDLREKTISTANGQKTLVEGEIADETGRVPFSAWEPEKLPPEFKANAVVRVKSAYVRAFRSVPNVNFGQYSTVEILDGDTLPEKDDLLVEKPYNIGALDAAGGGQGVLVEGVVLEVKKGSGLIFRCAHPDAAKGGAACNRVLQNRLCKIHPQKQEGVPDLRVKAVLDDGFGATTFFANREATEKLLGKTLAQCQQQARDAMTVDVIQEDLDRVLTAKRVVVRGNATKDEFGLQIIVSELDFAPERDLTIAAEKLLGSLVETLQEVSQ